MFPLYFPDTVQCSDPEISWRDSLQMAGGGPVKSELFKKDRKLCDPRPPGGPQVAGIKYVLHYMQSSQWNGVKSVMVI